MLIDVGGSLVTTWNLGGEQADRQDKDTPTGQLILLKTQRLWGMSMHVCEILREKEIKPYEDTQLVRL